MYVTWLKPALNGLDCGPLPETYMACLCYGEVGQGLAPNGDAGSCSWDMRLGHAWALQFGYGEAMAHP